MPDMPPINPARYEFTTEEFQVLCNVFRSISVDVPHARVMASILEKLHIAPSDLEIKKPS